MGPEGPRNHQRKGDDKISKFFNSKIDVKYKKNSRDCRAKLS